MKASKQMAQWQLQTEFGPLFLVSSERGLAGVYWTQQEAAMCDSLSASEPSVRCLARAVAQLTEFLEGRRQDFDLELDLQGTEFQKTVWRELNKIPYGETRSYRDIARAIGHDKAVRAVGTANGRNPLCIIIPCHRVIASGGGLGGYSGGLHIKTHLLELEGKKSVVSPVISQSRVS